MTYDEIIAFAPLALYAQNRDLTAEMPQLVKQAQDYVVSRLDHDAFATTTLPDTTISAEGMLDTSPITSRLLELRSLSWEFAPDRFQPLLPRAYEIMLMLYSDRPRGRPRYYAQADGFDPLPLIRVFPAPGRVLTARARGNIAPESLAPGVQENLLSRNFPQLLQYATAREAAVFMADPAMQQRWEDELTDALVAANAQVGRRTRDEAAQRPVDTRNARGS